MIYIARTPLPTVLQKYEKLWLENLRKVIDELNVLQMDSSASRAQIRQVKRIKDQAEGKYNHREIKNALVAMFYGKCAYCESPIRIVAYGHIEHFCPKSHPYCLDKIFDWNNLLLSCEICNDAAHKGTRFPIDASGHILLINPTDPADSPERHLKVRWDNETGIASIYGVDDRGKETEQTFDLNGLRGRKELLMERSRYIKMLLALVKFAEQGDTQALALLREACQPDAPYLAFVRSIIAPLLTQFEAYRGTN